MIDIFSSLLPYAFIPISDFWVSFPSPTELSGPLAHHLQPHSHPWASLRLLCLLQSQCSFSASSGSGPVLSLFAKSIFHKLFNFFKKNFILEYSSLWVGKMPWSRKQKPTPGFLPGKLHGQRNLEGRSPWGCKESDMTEQLSMNASILFQILSPFELLKLHINLSRVLCCSHHLSVSLSARPPKIVYFALNTTTPTLCFELSAFKKQIFLRSSYYWIALLSSVS